MIERRSGLSFKVLCAACHRARSSAQWRTLRCPFSAFRQKVIDGSRPQCGRGAPVHDVHRRIADSLFQRRTDLLRSEREIQVSLGVESGASNQRKSGDQKNAPTKQPQRSAKKLAGHPARIPIWRPDIEPGPRAGRFPVRLDDGILAIWTLISSSRVRSLLRLPDRASQQY
jgi:hypothetical protein